MKDDDFRLYSMQKKNEYKLYKSVEFNRREKEVSFEGVERGTYLIGVEFKYIQHDGKTNNIDFYELKVLMAVFKDCLEKRGQN